MNADDVRAGWLSAWTQATHAAAETKQSQEAVLSLFTQYEALAPHERDIVDGIISEQVLSPDESVRFGAIALVRQFRIASADAALRQLMTRLEQDDSPGAPYEWAKVNRVLANLAGSPR